MEQADNALQNQNGANPEGNSTETYNVKVGTDVNGEPIMQEVSKDELLNGYLRQQDYTRKTQELAAVKKGKAQESEGDETEDVKKTLTDIGFVTKDDIEKYMSSLTKQQNEESKLAQMIQSNPELKQFEGAIKAIAKTDNSAIEDIVVKYGFSTHDKLQKAKDNRSLVGNPNTVQGDKPKNVSEMSNEEYAKFKASIAKKGDFR